MGNFDNGHIKIFRKMLDWEWFSDVNTFYVFMYCLLKANWKDKKWRGIDVKRGSFITSRAHLSKELRLSEQAIRTALEHLESTNEITKSATAKYTVITVVKYNDYQSINQVNNQESTDKTTNNQPSSNQVATTTEESNKENKRKNTRKDERGRIVPINPPKKGWEWVDTMSPKSMLDHQEIDGWILEHDEDGFLWAHKKGRK